MATGPYEGCPAELLRVPFADFNCLKLPPGATSSRPTSCCSALLRGAAKVSSVGRVPERLAEAEQIGTIPVGYRAQAHDAGHEEPAIVLNELVETVRPTGMLGMPGLYVPSDRAGPARFRGLARAAAGEAPLAYERFDQRIEGCTKVVLHPGHALASPWRRSPAYVG